MSDLDYLGLNKQEKAAVKLILLELDNFDFNKQNVLTILGASMLIAANADLNAELEADLSKMQDGTMLMCSSAGQFKLTLSKDASGITENNGA